MKLAVVIVCVALPLGGTACTIGPAATDGGAGSSSPTRTRGEQCDSVDSAYCQQGPRCGIAIELAACIDNLRPLCCMGTACTAASTLSESTVTSCEKMIAALDCNVISQSQAVPNDCLTTSVAQ